MPDYDSYEIKSVVIVNGKEVTIEASLEEHSLVPEYVRHLFAIHLVKSLEVKFVKGHFN